MYLHLALHRRPLISLNHRAYREQIFAFAVVNSYRTRSKTTPPPVVIKFHRVFGGPSRIMILRRFQPHVDETLRRDRGRRGGPGLNTACERFSGEWTGDTADYT